MTAIPDDVVLDIAITQLHGIVVGNDLLVIADAAAQIANPGREAHLWNWPLVGTGPYKRVGDLSDLTFRLLIRVIEFLAKRLAGGVLEGPGVRAKQLLCIRVAKGNGLAVADVSAKHVVSRDRRNTFILEGRDGVDAMERGYVRGFDAVAKAELWERWRRGELLKAIGRAFGKPSSSIYFQVAPHGGIRPAPRRRFRLALTLSEREEILRGIAGARSMRSIARLLGRAPSTVSREIQAQWRL